MHDLRCMDNVSKMEKVHFDFFEKSCKVPDNFKLRPERI